MSRRGIRISEQLRKAQHDASDPRASVWVSANAGSGKTHVLTERVLRLMMDATPPEAILCLTYTKTAAAEMRARLSRRLGQWTLLADDELDAELQSLGIAAKPATRQLARALFARALETPGGLKIVTIHAFCESVLHRFPLEAGVPFGFRVLDDAERDSMLAATRRALLSEGLRQADPDVGTLFAELSDFKIEQVFAQALGMARRIRPVVADPKVARARLRDLVKPSGRSLADIRNDVVGGRLLDAGACRALVDAIPPVKTRGLTVRLSGIDCDNPDNAAWLSVFFTDGDLRKDLAGNALDKAAPHLAQLVLREAERLAALQGEETRQRLFECSSALIGILALLFARYDEAKRTRALLDFDDLIAAVNALLGAEDARAWVQYKLDAGIRHVLVDESQDTNPEQWGAIDRLVEEFFAGEGQISAPRTLFSVGDPKQSIYSFQGADPELFELKGRHYARAAAAAGKPFQNVAIHDSFRTLTPLLDAVDRVFDDPARRAAVLSLEPVLHRSARTEPGGQVVVWPGFAPPEAVRPAGAWPLVPAEGQHKSAERALAEHIAREIAFWLGAGRRLASGRTMRADDVMILLQTRSALYFEIIRALGGQGLSTPGADRLAVHEHIAVLDLLALGDVLVNRDEDLQLAALLRSPLFGLDEDELFALAHGRRGTLWQALKTSDNPAAREAHKVLGALRERLDRLRPYELFADMLYARGGLKRLKSRLGPEVDDVIAEFLALALAHEQADQPGLEGFLAQMRARQVSIKRELTEIGGGVRVMTIHAAKGLEAPVVVLADALAKPSSSTEKQGLHVVPTPAGETLVYAGSQAEHVDETHDTRKQTLAGIEREYWRKLYVGMTRAEEALYVGGAYKGNAKPETQREGSWYGAICETLFGISGEIDEPLVWAVPAAEDEAAAPVEDEAGRVEDAPPLVLAPLVERPPVPVLTPSGLGIAHTPLGLDTRAQQAIDADLARRRGIALHALLDHLMRVVPQDREAAGRAALSQLLAEDRAGHETLLAKALRIIGAPEFGRIFGPESRGEVPFMVPAHRDGQAVRLTGRIDRLVVDAAGVLVVDYKSDAAIPDDPAAVPANYRAQLSLYAMVAGQLFPGRQVKAGILWTAPESLMVLPDAMLAQAGRGFTLG